MSIVDLSTRTGILILLPCFRFGVEAIAVNGQFSIITTRTLSLLRKNSCLICFATPGSDDSPAEVAACCGEGK